MIYTCISKCIRKGLHCIWKRQSFRTPTMYLFQIQLRVQSTSVLHVYVVLEYSLLVSVHRIRSLYKWFDDRCDVVVLVLCTYTLNTGSFCVKFPLRMDICIALLQTTMYVIQTSSLHSLLFQKCKQVNFKLVALRIPVKFLIKDFYFNNYKMIFAIPNILLLTKIKYFQHF